ncbi:hypothetical protein L596_030588 [Steinernema carpocapsae]|uniref:Uncharacterized protein n=1 Tax=Steinernema carpocapsae TaxID=34508 RepID=A0A4U5LPU6_STECR|nr:hypothetical protein L596_030588 [Steinernema carpocapsae]
MQSSSFSGPYEPVRKLENALEMTCAWSATCLVACLKKRLFVSTRRISCVARHSVWPSAVKRGSRSLRVQSTAQHARVRWVHLHSLSDDIGAAQETSP